MARLKKLYMGTIRSKLKERFSFQNIHQVPQLDKIVVNCVTRDAAQNAKVVENISQDLSLITGQRPVVSRAKKSVASFKVREGQPLGACVTLRGQNMYEFFDRLVSLSLPRVRDFQGVPRNGFDGKGNFNLGVKEQIIFPEINYDKIDKVRGLNITFVTTAKNNDEARALLAEMGMPFKKA